MIGVLAACAFLTAAQRGGSEMHSGVCALEQHPTANIGLKRGNALLSSRRHSSVRLHSGVRSVLEARDANVAECMHGSCGIIPT